MYERILVAADGSSNSIMAVEKTAELARLADSAEVLVLHVCPGCTADIDTKDINREAAEELVHRAGELITQAGIPVRTMVEEAPSETIASTIADIAAREDASLVVIGSRGLGEVKGWLLGSISSKVVQRTHCPVLVVKANPEP